MINKYSILITTILFAGLAQGQQQDQADPQTEQNATRLETLNRPATANLRPTKGNQAKGTVTFTPTDDANKVKVQVHLSQLKPGSVHGMHVHEKGDCSAADASSAGGHGSFAGVSSTSGGRRVETRFQRSRHISPNARAVEPSTMTCTS